MCAFRWGGAGSLARHLIHGVPSASLWGRLPLLALGMVTHSRRLLASQVALPLLKFVDSSLRMKAGQLELRRFSSPPQPHSVWLPGAGFVLGKSNCLFSLDCTSSVKGGSDLPGCAGVRTAHAVYIQRAWHIKPAQCIVIVIMYVALLMTSRVSACTALNLKTGCFLF